MEETSSGEGEAMLGWLKALARRGALMQRGGDGNWLISCEQPRRPAVCVTMQGAAALARAGLLRTDGENRLALSRKGLRLLRARLSHPNSSEARRVVDAQRQALEIPARQESCGVRPDINTRESPLAWLRQRRDRDGRGLISDIQFEAGERLRADFERAQLGPRVTASWDAGAVSGRQARGAPGAHLELSDLVVGARQRVEQALKSVGPELSGLLLDVCCFLKGLEQAERDGSWPRRSGKAVLQVALSQLARHYGLDRSSERPALSVRLWRAEGWPPPRAEAGHVPACVSEGEGH